jgi:outer membrane receptor for ferric coprogen and ferric-rhodotorulic acid
MLGESQSISFELDDLTDDLSGSGWLSEQGINNLSNRDQQIRDMEFQWLINFDLLGSANSLVAGVSYFEGLSSFEALLELSDMDPLTRLTAGIGTGLFVNRNATNIDTSTKTRSLYVRNSTDLTDSLTLILSARLDDTKVTLKDQSGLRLN